SLAWTERGPISDSINPGNANTRAGLNATSGFTTAILIDTLNDPSGNTVLFGSNTGGIWKCTNFLSPVPNWSPVNDYYETLNIGSICQDPTSPNVMYFASGTQFYGSILMYGDGIWKSVDAGNSWSKLPTSAGLNRGFKIMCDAAGNIYTAQRAATGPVAQPYGLFRSKDHGATWINITPAGLTSSNSTCTDIEISGSGRLHGSFGYQGTLVNHWYTDDPANVTPGAGWFASTGIRSIASPPAATRMELACQGTTLYAVTVNPSTNADSCYKSTDDGVTWTKQNTVAYPTRVLNFQGTYAITLSINPSNANEFIIGGLDAYKSSDGGVSVGSAITHWIGLTPPYVHADHHFMQWWNVGAESRIIIAGDGGIFLSRDGGATFSDRNKNL
ncbi:MAG TPA: hypothetical protein VKH37_05285, partial [Ferruginibacter sp.]|nr:hypothetical protein [Ferruginibacter sp.]